MFAARRLHSGYYATGCRLWDDYTRVCRQITREINRGARQRRRRDFAMQSLPGRDLHEAPRRFRLLSRVCCRAVHTFGGLNFSRYIHICTSPWNPCGRYPSSDTIMYKGRLVTGKLKLLRSAICRATILRKVAPFVTYIVRTFGWLCTRNTTARRRRRLSQFFPPFSSAEPV